ncbi:MAG: DUF4105 domain-containing protein [Bacteriovoracaceae bacterium]|nr:DUF4105 domain-containing protein [Bacteriovoracaceae bacterium]
MYLIKITFYFLTRGKFHFPLFLLLNFTAFADENLVQSQQWLNLLRYKDQKSLADGKDFFVSPDGKYDPQAELTANIEAAKKNTIIRGETYACRFPARYLFLKKHLKDIPEYNIWNNCPEFSVFFKRLNPRKVHMVFSSYFISRPASAFGHTLLRISPQESSSESERSELLDNGINYAAVVTTSNSFLYGVAGIFGGFEGRFATLPYYYKVREYNDYESRDLWIYEMEFNQTELNFLVANIWEMRNTYFDYFYFDENCSYHLLFLLDTVRPELKLTDSLQTFVTPVDTVKAIVRSPGLVSRIKYRPSKRKQFEKKFSLLTTEEKDILDGYLKNDYDNQRLTNVGVEKKAKVLDIAIDYFDYENAKDLLSEDKEVTAKKSKILLALAQTKIRVLPKEIPRDENDQPHDAHELRRANLNFGKSDIFNNYTELRYRFALHDVHDQFTGNPMSNLEMLNLSLRKYENRKPLVHQIDFINAEALIPIEKYFFDPSYKLYLGVKRLRDAECFNCLSGTTEVGLGLTYPILEKFYLMTHLEGEFNYNPHFEQNHFRLGAGPSIGLLLQTRFNLNLSTKFQHLRYDFSQLKETNLWKNILRWSFKKNHALNLEHISYQTDHESQLGYMYYF